MIGLWLISQTSFASRLHPGPSSCGCDGSGIVTFWSVAQGGTSQVTSRSCGSTPLAATTAVAASTYFRFMPAEYHANILAGLRSFSFLATGTSFLTYCLAHDQ